ncbi:hypothetical protein Pat9b_4487 (plasmid) [Pantoea sp. At-9b]|nr:hypothetical protein Pat9b_4487 [Pantoea sp. At-9b]
MVVVNVVVVTIIRCIVSLLGADTHHELSIALRIKYTIFLAMRRDHACLNLLIAIPNLHHLRDSAVQLINTDAISCLN